MNTVGELLDALKGYDRDTPLRVRVDRGNVDALKLTKLAGRVVIGPKRPPQPYRFSGQQR